MGQLTIFFRNGLSAGVNSQYRMLSNLWAETSAAAGGYSDELTQTSKYS